MKKNLSLAIFLILIFIYNSGCIKQGTTPQRPSSNTANQPIITSIFPLSARGGDSITAYGKNLLSVSAKISLTINNKPLSIISVSDDSILAQIPPMVGSGNIVLSVGGNEYSGPELTYNYTVVVTTIAGSGTVGNSDGPGLSASFYCPWGIAADANGDLYVADCYNRLIRKISGKDQSVSSFSIPTLVGAQNFYSPNDIAVDTVTHNLYVTDFNQHLLKMDPDGNASVIYVDTVNMPLAGIAVSPDRKSLFVSNNTAGLITKMNIDGTNPTIFTTGLTTPRNIIFDNNGQMFVAAYPASIYSISTSGLATPAANDPQFQGWEIAKDTSGNFYLADHFSNQISMIDKQGNITIIAGSGIAADVDGIGTNASFNGPQGMTIDGNGNLYVTTFNYLNNTGNKVRKISLQ